MVTETVDSISRILFDTLKNKHCLHQTILISLIAALLSR